MSDEEIHELFALNRKEMKEEMLKLLRQKTSIVCDRYAYSGVAYSSAKVILSLTFVGFKFLMVQES